MDRPVLIIKTGNTIDSLLAGVKILKTGLHSVLHMESSRKT